MTQICCCGDGIYKGSTPSLFFNINTPLVNIDKMTMIFSQCGTIILEKNKDDITTVDEDTIKVKLTQKETLMFSSKYEIEAQIRIKYTSGAAVTSAITCFNIGEVLKNEVI